MIKKPTIIITSLGRTGTTYLADFLQKYFVDAAVFHEPGIIDLKNFNIQKIFKSIKDYGFTNAVLKKILGIRDIESISSTRIKSKINISTAAKKLIKARKKFIYKFDKNIYIESNYHYYGLLDILGDAFENYRAIFIIRDPRDWVRSAINKKWMYHKSDINIYLRNRIIPSMVYDKINAKKWKNMDQFERLCWAWNYINSYAIKSAHNNKNTKIFLFEDLFTSPNKFQNQKELLNFISEIVGTNQQNNLETKNILIEKSLAAKINKSPFNILPKWTEWDKEKAIKLQSHCGEIMKKLGYGYEDKWKKLIS